MTESGKKFSAKRLLEMPQKRLALVALELQDALDRRERESNEPIAVVGMSCRFPGGASSPDAYWDLLDRGEDAIGPVPADRWDSEELLAPEPDPSKLSGSRFGGFLDEVARFDSHFFSISPREALAMDPQQRMLLEESWRAFEDAGIPPDALRGSRTGVFVGVCNNDYLTRVLAQSRESIDIYASTGNAYSVAAGRISFVYGFEGPAMSIDTACSSSLVAIATACRSLRSGESSVAVAGGVNIMCSPDTTLALARSGMLAPDGRCKAFDERADGFVRAEGCGVLILKRLSEAERDGDRIHAVLRGVAVGQDGRSTGLTVPNGPAQANVIRDALHDAEISPDGVQLIEAHGTGTSLGDPIEMGALKTVFGAGRDTPLFVGTAKSNIGHLESAAGVAGLIKAILALQHGRIPRSLHVENPSGRIDWDGWPVEVPNETVAWPDVDAPRRAGVSSFGFSGTNAHIVVEEAPSAEEDPSSVRDVPSELLLLSATSDEALGVIRSDFAHLLRTSDDAHTAAVCHTARVGRTSFGYRTAVVARSGPELAAALDGDAESASRLDSDGRCQEAPEWAFVFTGQGAQHPGMGRELYEHAPLFRERIDRCAEILADLLPHPLTSILFEGDGDDAPIYTTALAQPAVVAFEWSLAELWRSWGIEPAAVIGHSLGEFAAAIVAGVLSLEDGLRLVAERGRLLDTLPRGDRMIAVFADPERVEALAREAAGSDGRLETSAFNAPESVVLAGDPATTQRLIECAAAEGIETRTLKLERGFHTSAVEPMLDALESFAEGLEHAAPRLPIVSNTSGELAVGQFNARHWRDHTRDPVRFSDGVRTLEQLGYRHFLEIGPHPALAPLVGQTLEEEGVVVASLHRERGAWNTLCEAAARLFVAGAELRGAQIRPETPDRVPVPGHPLNGDRYWIERRSGSLAPSRAPLGSAGEIPGWQIDAAVPIWETVLTPERPAFLEHHRFAGEPVLPGPAFAQLALAAARRLGGTGVNLVRDVEIRVPASVGPAGLRVQTMLTPLGNDTWSFRILSRGVDTPADGAWVEHATGEVGIDSNEGSGSRGDIDSAPGRSGDIDSVSLPDHIEMLRSLGLELGRGAIAYRDPRAGSGRAEAEFAAFELEEDPAAAAMLALDGAAQLLGVALAEQARTRDLPIEPLLLSRVERIRWLGDPADAHHGVANVTRPSDGESARGDVSLFAQDGTRVAELLGVELLRVRTGAAPAGSASNDTGWLMRQEWRPYGSTGEPTVAMDREVFDSAATEVRSGWDALQTECDLPSYLADLPALNRHAVERISSTLEELGIPDTFDADDELPPGVDPARRRPVERLAQVVKSYRSEEGGSGHATVSPASATVDDWIRRFGDALESVLRGERDPIDVVFGDDEGRLATTLYADTPFGLAYNRQLGDAVRALAERLPTDRELRVLEIGAGTGSTTRHVLGALANRSFSYTWTDISSVLVDRARATFESAAGAKGRIEFTILDLDEPLSDQGIAEGGFDLVIGGNVVHATRDVLRTLSRIRQALRPGGAALLLEGTEREPWVDMSFGLLPGWWAFEDTSLRPDYPLLSAEQWQDALDRSGFESVQGLTSEGGRQELLIARRPEPVAPRIVDARTVSSASELLPVIRDVAPSPDGSRSGDGPSLWIVTASAQVPTGDDVPNETQAAVWGLARTFALEHPDVWGGIVDVASDDPRPAAEIVTSYAGASGVEDQVAERAGQAYVPRIVPSRSGVSADIDGAFQARGSWVIAGGLGGLGLEWAEELLRRGAERVVLLGRTGPDAWSPDDPRLERLRDLDSWEGEVDVRSLDASDTDAVRALFADLRSSGPPVRGVIHSAATIEVCPLAELSEGDLDRSLTSKVGVATALVDAARSDELDHVLLFSSTTSLLGVSGMGAYAAANQALDACAGRLRRDGIPAISVQWGVWDRLRRVDEQLREQYVRTGWRPMDPARVFGILDSIVEPLESAGRIVADADWEQLRAVYELRRPRPILADIASGDEMHASVADGGVPDTSALHETAPDTPGSDFDRLVRLDPVERGEALLHWVEDRVKKVLQVPGARALDLDEGFFDMGMDSLMSVELRNRLAKETGLKFSGTLAFNYPSVRRLADYLGTRIGGGSGPEERDVSAERPIEASDGDLEAELARRLERLEAEGHR